MRTNKALKFLLTIIAIPIAIPAMITNLVGGCLLFFPPIGLIYVLVMTLIWLPSAGFVLGTIWLWEKVRILRLPIALIGVPIVALIEAFLFLMPNPDQKDKELKLMICDAWPLSKDVVSSSRG